jgi:hypothetical protein
MLSLNTAYLSSNAIDNIALPVQTPSYTPVPHRQLMHQVMSAFTSNGFDIDRPAHQIHKKKPRFVSTFSVSGGGLPNDKALDWMVGVMNSYDSSRSVTLLFGARVFVCSNGMIVADHKLKTRHTLNVWDRIPDLIATSVDAFGETICKAQRRNDQLREIVVDDRRMIDAFAMEVARRGLLPETKAVAYADEIHNPSFDYGVKENTLWNIHNAYTHTAKGMEAGDFARRVIQFDKLLDATFVAV